jgi:hypothetical protein
MMTKEEEKRLEYLCKKYKNGRDLDKEDEYEVREWSTVGFFNMGCSLRRKVCTAKTACYGLKLIGAK